MSIHIISLTGSQIDALHPRIVAIYREAYALPPYRKPEREIAEFSESLSIHMVREAFRFLGAFNSPDDQLAGFAYGYTSQPGHWWYEHVRPGLSEQTAAAWLEDSFQFTELAVHSRAQGQGAGGRLHDELLRGLRHKRAVLSTLQAETVAHRLYRSRGWVALRQDFFFPGVERRYQILGLALQKK